MTFTHHSATWSEIFRQPEIWRDWAPALAAEAAAIRGWIEASGIKEIWLCGAGTSAFIGEILAAAPTTPGGPRLRPIATTDFVARPGDFIRDSGEILVIQFGRSGDSSETVGMLDLLDQAMPKAHRLHVTCNPGGALASRVAPGPGSTRVLLLPEATHDSGFAMTSSFTTMLLSALACVDADFDAGRELPRLADAARPLLATLAAEPLASPPARLIFLGSGALKGVAREAALKVLELTAGQVSTHWDSTLGFRHGPKAAIVPGTSVVLMLHPDPHTGRYDADVAAELSRQYPGIELVTIGQGGGQGSGQGSATTLQVPGDFPDRALAVLYVLVAQVWAVRWSEALGLEVDNPFAGGTLSRVVAGITLYPWAA